MSRSCRFPKAAGAEPRAPIVSESAVPGRACVGLLTNGSPDCTSELCAAPPVGEPAGYPPGLLPLSDLAMPIGPFPVDRVPDGLRGFVVVPHPR